MTEKKGFNPEEGLDKGEFSKAEKARQLVLHDAPFLKDGALYAETDDGSLQLQFTDEQLETFEKDIAEHEKLKRKIEYYATLTGRTSEELISERQNDRFRGEDALFVETVQAMIANGEKYEVSQEAQDKVENFLVSVKRDFQRFDDQSVRSSDGYFCCLSDDVGEWRNWRNRHKPVPDELKYKRNGFSMHQLNYLREILSPEFQKYNKDDKRRKIKRDGSGPETALWAASRYNLYFVDSSSEEGINFSEFGEQGVYNKKKAEIVKALFNRLSDTPLSEKRKWKWAEPYLPKE